MNEKMNGWRLEFHGDPWENLNRVELVRPTPGAGQVQVRVAAADLNFADILQCQGSYQVKLETPFVPGMSAAGTITEVGNEVTLQVGQTVVGPTIGRHGGFAEYALMDATMAYSVPDGIDKTLAASMHVTYPTGWFGLHRRGNLQPGESVLVLAGAGGVGSAAIQLAKTHGCWVLAAAGGAEKQQACLNFGADVAIDYNAEDLYQQVKKATSGRGVDVVYDPVGGAHFDVARRLLAWEGRLLVIGFAGGTVPSAPANHVLVKNYSVVGVHMAGYYEREPTLMQHCYDELYQLVLDERMHPPMPRLVEARALPMALKQLSDRSTIGRLVFVP